MPGKVLGGLAGVPGAFCEFEGFGVIPGRVPEPLFTAEHGGRLPGVCEPDVEPGVDPGVVVLGVEGEEGDVCDGLV